ncbi:MAG TPA: RHS repeat-associated core domain-containing protein, partial [Kineosporiaceae bacterium]|nr:RHS repeat-associated core domain-containing protein [Kineosporiaceae bacterium]
ANPTSIGGTATLARIFYDTPLTGSALPDLSTTSIGTWAQASAPTYAAAVFGPDAPALSAAPAATSSDWQYARLAYTDAGGYTVNTADYGAGAWQVTATDYDAYGNVIRTLDPGATGALKAGTAQGTADQLATLTRYNGPGDAITTAGQPAGTVVIDQWGPARKAANDQGQLVWGRPHTHYTYDEGAPNADNAGFGFPYTMVTTTTTGMADGATGSTDPAYAAPADIVDYAKELTGYAPIDGASVAGPTSGWTLGQATTKTTVMVTSTDIVRKTRYDVLGHVVETRMPTSSGTDAGTTLAVYYQAGTGSGDAACDNHPEWAGLVCRAYPAAAPNSGPTMPDKRVTAYTLDTNPATITETSGTTVRTTTATYDIAGRPSTAAVAVTGLTGTQAIPTRKTSYDPVTGLPTTVADLNSSGATVADIVTGYDSWGRQTSYRDAAPGATATATVYDASGRVSSVTDAKGTTTYGYGADANTAVERRGRPTSITVTGVGTFTGAYNALGQLTLQKLPGGFQQTTKYDNAGVPLQLTYSGPDATGATVPWLGWWHNNDALGRVRHEDNPAGGVFTGALGSANAHNRIYTYGRGNRLTDVRDRTNPTTGSLDATGAACQTRVYTYSRNGNRTKYVVNNPTATGGCSTTNPATTSTWTYDTADRVTNTGYTYDTLGRTLTIPATTTGAAATFTYYTDDTAQAITSGSATQTFGLDPASRRLTDTWTTSGTTTRTTTRHYTDATDNPGWTEDVQGSNTVISRYTETLGGGLGAATTSVNGTTSVAALFLSNPHGDITATVTLPSTGNPSGVDYFSDYMEYGAPSTGSRTGTGQLAYGWLGAAQRSADTPSGLILMGARLYDPTTGRFTSLDPVTGGNENAYTYPNDPMGSADVSGKFTTGWSSSCWGACVTYKVYFNRSETKVYSSFFGIAGLLAGLRAAAIKDIGRHIATSLAKKMAAALTSWVGVFLTGYALGADLSNSCIGVAMWGTIAWGRFIGLGTYPFYHNQYRCR